MRNRDGATQARIRSIPLPGGLAGRMALAILAGGVLLLGLSVLLQAGKQHRQYSQMQQVQLRQAVQQASLAARSRVGNAEVLLRSATTRTRNDVDGSWNGLRAILQQDAGFFGTVAILDADAGPDFRHGARDFTLSTRGMGALRDGS